MGEVRGEDLTLAHPMNIRLPRTALLARLTDPNAPEITLLEAPIGFGKSWLLRRAAPEGCVRLRGQIGALRDEDVGSTPIVIDDAHLMDAADTRILVERIEDAPSSARLIIAGRILTDPLHEVAHLLDGQILDTSALAVTTDELVAVVDELARPVADQIVQAAEGCVKLITTALEQWRRQPDADPVSVVSQLSHSANAAALQGLDSADAALVGLLARAPGIDQALLASLGGPGLLWRALNAGVPMRRRIAGDIDVLDGAFFRAHDIDPATANTLATALVQRDRPIEAVGLLLDASAHDRAARMLMEFPESIIDTVEPRALLGVLARLGTVTEQQPSLLLLRANASSLIGRLDLMIADVEKAVVRASDAEPRVRRRVNVAAARMLLSKGDRDSAVARALDGLRDLGPGEERTFARAHEVLADAISTHENRNDLQRAAESFRVAAAAWESCGEHARARVSRCNLAMTVLIPLGRYDDALRTLGEILSVPGLTDAERSWLLACEGFGLYSANRLDSATARLERVTDLGRMLDNSQIVALAAWGRALVEARRGNVADTYRWIATAENTALGDFDDALGVKFLCDMATSLGALGELDAAERYLERAEARPALFPDEVTRTRWLLNARRGLVADVEQQVLASRPEEWWRIRLVAAFAYAQAGEFATAQSSLEDAERELMGLGFGDFVSLGERETVKQLQSLLQRRPAPALAVERTGAWVPGGLSHSMAGRRIRVIGGPIVVEENGAAVEVPPGNPQRLVGVVVASGGSASFDQLAEAMWPGDDSEAGRARLRNVLLRLRRGVGDVIARSGSGVRLAQGVGCDLYEFERLATDSLSSARTDPELAGQLAERAVSLVEGAIFSDFEYEEWALASRRSAEHQLIGLLDLLSVQAEDAGDLPRAQALAERALRLDRYTDSRYVRLAELLTMQGRTAAAVAVLEDASEVARELGAPLPEAAKERRDDLIRRAANS